MKNGAPGDVELAETPDEADEYARLGPSPDEAMVGVTTNQDAHFPSLLAEVAITTRNPSPASQAFAPIAAGSGCTGGLVYVQSVLDLVQAEKGSMLERIAYLAGTVGTNIILNAYFIYVFLTDLATHYFPVLNRIGYKTEPWGLGKTITVFFNALVAGAEFALLGYKTFLGPVISGLLLPIQFLIYTALQFYGALRAYSKAEWLLTMCFGDLSKKNRIKLAEKILKHFENALENLEDDMKHCCATGGDAPLYIKSMIEIHNRLLAATSKNERKAFANQLLSCLVRQPQLIERPGANATSNPSADLLPFDLIYGLARLIQFTTLVFASVSAVSYWNATYDALLDETQHLRGSQPLSLSSSLYGIANFAILLLMVATDLTDSAIHTVARMHHSKYNPWKRFRSLRERVEKTLPYALCSFLSSAMNQIKGFSAGMLAFLYTLAALSWATSARLQIVATNERFDFMNHPAGLYMFAVVYVTILFNSFGDKPFADATAKAIVKRQGDMHGDFEHLLATLIALQSELNNAGSEAVIVLLAQLLFVLNSRDASLAIGDDESKFSAALRDMKIADNAADRQEVVDLMRSQPSQEIELPTPSTNRSNRWCFGLFPWRGKQDQYGATPNAELAEGLLNGAHSL